MAVTNVTLLANLINPEVMADMISAELVDKLVATGLYKVDTQLVGRPGNTITVPKYIYVGAAEDLPENTEGTIVEMTSESAEYTVKKAVKNIVLTDEAMLSGHGDPIGQATVQLRLAIQDKVDNDGIAALSDIPTATGGLVYAEPAGFTYATIINALELLRLEEQPEGGLYLLVSRGIAKQIKLDPAYIDRFTAMGDTMLASGAIGTLGGCQVIVSNKIPDDDVTAPRAFIVPMGGITAFLKRDVFLETERDLLFKRTIFGVDQHYVVAIEDYTKLCAITVVTP